MSKVLLLNILFVSVFFSVRNSSSNRFSHDALNQNGSFQDSSVYLFGSNLDKLTLHIFNSTNHDEQTKNAILTFSRQGKVIFQDSLFCMYPDISFQDFNNDGVKDVLVFYSTGARANPTYHLYLADNKNHKLIGVKGFEKLPNPSLGKPENIITSIALSGSNYYSFYRITSKNKLINLGHSFEENPRDSTQYERAIRKILKENK